MTLINEKYSRFGNSDNYEILWAIIFTVLLGDVYFALVKVVGYRESARVQEKAVDCRESAPRAQEKAVGYRESARVQERVVDYRELALCAQERVVDYRELAFHVQEKAVDYRESGLQ